MRLPSGSLQYCSYNRQGLVKMRYGRSAMNVTWPSVHLVIIRSVSRRGGPSIKPDGNDCERRLSLLRFLVLCRLFLPAVHDPVQLLVSLLLLSLTLLSWD